MSGWKAWNVESDDESDVEVDNTKELQIEEALKLYQDALKLHSEGPKSFEQAALAYEELFKSEIFLYPESQAELQRIELYGAQSDSEDSWQDASYDVVDVSATALDTGPSTLPQILHLSHKNYAQFKLEFLAARMDTFNITLNQILSDATHALTHFTEALDKDDTDLNLWRKTASVGSMLDSKRIARFCLEATLEGDDDGLNDMLSLPGLEEGLAGQRLRELVGALEDQLSALQDPLSTSKRRVLSKMLKQRLDSYQHIVDRGDLLREQQDYPIDPPPQRVMLHPPKTWAEVGDVLLRQLMADQNGTGSKTPALTIAFDLDSVPSSELRAIEPAQSPKQSRPTSRQLVIMPKQINEQFPGLDHGEPTTQPSIACADPNMQALTRVTTTDTDLAMTESPTTTLPTRKRSGDAAGLDESPEEGRTKSKRTRTRDSTAADDSKQAILDANTRWELEQKLAELQAADDWMFETVGNLFERIGVVGFEAGKHVRQEIQPSTGDALSTNNNGSAESGLQVARADLCSFLNNYSDQMAKVLTAGGESFDSTPGPFSAGAAGSNSNTASTAISKPTLPSDEDLPEFLTDINRRWLTLQEVAWEWICILLRSQHSGESNNYVRYLWPENLKTMVVRTLVNFDESFRNEITNEFEAWKASSTTTHSDHSLADLIETIFELHLDIYCLIKEHNSGVDADTINAQSNRLLYWSTLARETMHFRSQKDATPRLADDLDLRFLWATAFQIASDSDNTQEYVIDSLNDLKAILVEAEAPMLQLQNNAIMPEISISTLERKISQLTTKDFFQKVTSQDAQDPVSMIESLEPLLTSLDRKDLSLSERNEHVDEMQAEVLVDDELVRFLESSDISTRVMLWQRLRDAYTDIDYKPMVLSCYFKMIKLVLTELKKTTSNNVPEADRQVGLLKSIRLVHNMIARVVSIAQGAKNAFECIDEDGLRAAIASFGEVLQLLQVFNIFEDSIRIGQSQPPSLPNGLPAASFAGVTSLLHNLEVNVWITLYFLFKESIFQFHDLFPVPADDMFDFLKVVHRNLGLRGICGSSNMIFVRLLKEEFFQMTHVEGYESEQAQVLYDLYGLNCFLNPNYELMEHNCTHSAFLERSVALQAIDLLLLQASKLPMKDLIKHPIKETIDKVHGAAPRKKPTEAIMRNREVQRAFLRSPINPLDLYRCLQGESNQLNVAPIPKTDAPLASKGWFFLMGHIALAKFRSVKRTTQTPTEEVDIAIAFFMQDLEYSSENWETWFRLAQAYDTKIEESVVWSAEKLNNSMNEIAQLQRAAIHCYTMATALAYRSAEPTIETSEKMTEMFYDFATRLYASSRPPFDMLPFALDDEVKFLNIEGQGVEKYKPFQPLPIYTCWKLAKTFFQKAMPGRPDSWTLHFALGKCLWKMHAASDHISGLRDVRPPAQQVLHSLFRAIDCIPDKKDSREKKEPVLEPHYKLVSVVHKMVVKGSVSLAEAKEALEHTPYARNATFPSEFDEWVPYVLAVLKNLRNADKSHWHHRMIERAARIVYDDSADGPGSAHNLGALGAKHELTQQMFTKTMVLNVWKPDSERAGRHFVYTSRYTRFLIRIFEQLKDRNHLEMLARRTRRKPQEFFEHSLVWQELCFAYLGLLRNYSTLPEGLETSTFSTIAHEDFLQRKEPLEKWMQAQETGNFPALDVLREVQELKKINAGLMKPAPIDDLIGDSYACLFNTVGRQLWDEERRLKHEEEAQRPTPLQPSAVSPPRNPMMSLTSLMNVDGAPDSETASRPTPPIPTIEPATDQLPVRRKIGVGRREIRLCAEQSNYRPPAPKERALPRVEVVIPPHRPLESGMTSVEHSRPGSDYSADDESELSELEEDGNGEGVEDSSPPTKTELRPMFPGLLSNDASRDASEGFETAEEEIERGDADVEVNEIVADADGGGVELEEQVPPPSADEPSEIAPT